MHQSDMMVTDLSGVLFDYAYLFGKPILLAFSDAPTGGYEAEDVQGPLWDVWAARELSVQYSGNPETLCDQVKQLIGESDVSMEKIRDFKNKNMRNFGTAGNAAALELKRMLMETQ
jgi:CDP-glycerol glycerophosphotransferase (TagB/SpsB family)